MIPDNCLMMDVLNKENARWTVLWAVSQGWRIYPPRNQTGAHLDFETRFAAHTVAELLARGHLRLHVPS